MLGPKEIVHVMYKENKIIIVCTLNSQIYEWIITKDNKELFNYMEKYKSKIPFTDIRNIPNNTQKTPLLDIYGLDDICRAYEYICIRPCIEMNKVYALKCNIKESQMPFIKYLKPEDIYKSTREVNRDYYDFYLLILGKELATLACVLDMPPEIACLLKEV